MLPPTSNTRARGNLKGEIVWTLDPEKASNYEKYIYHCLCTKVCPFASLLWEWGGRGHGPVGEANLVGNIWCRFLLPNLVGFESQVPSRAIWVASPNRVERAYKSKCRFAMALFWNRIHKLQRELLFVPKPAGRKRQMQILLHMTTPLSVHLSMICLRFLFNNEYVHIVFAQLSQLSLSHTLSLSVSALSLSPVTLWEGSAFLGRASVSSSRIASESLRNCDKSRHPGWKSGGGVGGQPKRVGDFWI